MTANVFVDTNVLVYARDASESEKHKKAQAWMTKLWTERTGRLSFQVLQEYYVTVTEKLDPGMDPSSARDDVRSFFAWDPIPVDHRAIIGALSIQDNYGFSWWDALIVSAAQLIGCRYLLTEDLQADQTIGNVQIINPFQKTYESIEL